MYMSYELHTEDSVQRLFDALEEWDNEVKVYFCIALNAQWRPISDNLQLGLDRPRTRQGMGIHQDSLSLSRSV